MYTRKKKEKVRRKTRGEKKEGRDSEEREKKHCPLITLSLALVISRAMRSVVAESAVVKAEVVVVPPLPSSRPVVAIVVADSNLHRNTKYENVCSGGRVRRTGVEPGVEPRDGTYTTVHYITLYFFGVFGAFFSRTSNRIRRRQV